MEEAKIVCLLEFSLLTENAVSVDPLTMIIYGRKDYIQYHCTNLKNSETGRSFPMKEITKVRATVASTGAFTAGQHKGFTNPSL